MSKLSPLFTISLLLSFMLTYAARPEPTLSGLAKIQLAGDIKAEKFEVEESCQGLGEEECLKRRTLAAHLDYIYTQEHKP